MSRIVFLCFLTFSLVSGVSDVALAQGGKANKARERLEIITMWKMMEALDLDSETSDKIMEIRRRFLSQRKEIERSLGEDFRKLKQQLEDQNAPDDKELEKLLGSIHAKRKKIEQLRDEQYNEISKILPIRKQAELVLFLKEFRKELPGLLRPPPPGGPFGEPPPLPPAKSRIE